MKSDRHKKNYRFDRELSKKLCVFFDDVISFFENLTKLHDENFIAIKKIIDIFVQIFKTFHYLHSRDVTHRNLKSKNILIEFRFFLNIKFVDFDFANDKFDLKIVCDIQQYIALEIYSNSEYKISVNL